MASDIKQLGIIIAPQINSRPDQAAAAIALLDEGATVPFIARYRKEATGSLDDTQLRLLAERLSYLRELDARRSTILDSIRSQGKLTVELESMIAGVTSKSELEDIYLPYKPKRRTRAQIARERGLGPLADSILAERHANPEDLAMSFLGGEITDLKTALDGARDIIAEMFAENAALIGRLRNYMRERAFLRSVVADGKQEAGVKYSDYFDHAERLAGVPSHRALAMLRGRNEDVLTLTIEVDADENTASIKSVPVSIERMMMEAYSIGRQGTGDKWLAGVVGWAWRTKLSLSLSLDLIRELRQAAEDEAIKVFARNLKDLLLAAPAGARATLGLDPGIRTGVKVAAIDATGKVLETATVYPFPPANDVRGAQAELARLVLKHQIELVAIGNGTGSRETEKLVSEMLGNLPAHPGGGKPLKVIVSEAGASVYSASQVAANELPGMDVSLRGAVSIARRLQDPLAELVKIEPKAIGVGQYQHDVDQIRLGRMLETVVEDAVNAVGVDLNTASPALLSYVSGLGASLAQAIVLHRNTNGAFSTRKDLLKVERLGPRAFEQSAGFLRIRGGKEPLDASAVHPEAYGVARKIVAACGRDLRTLMGDSAVLRSVDPARFVDDKFGLPTVKDILGELEKPGRGPRPEFKTAIFADGIDDMKDLKSGMLLEGTVTNVATFGAFIDIGVHQDGLVHVSQLADRFVKDPHEIVKAGDVVKVRVVEVDVKRKRIGLSMRKQSGEDEPREHEEPRSSRNADKGKAIRKKQETKDGVGSFGAALNDALKRK